MDDLKTILKRKNHIMFAYILELIDTLDYNLIFRCVLIDQP